MLQSAQNTYTGDGAENRRIVTGLSGGIQLLFGQAEIGEGGYVRMGSQPGEAGGVAIDGPDFVVSASGGQAPNTLGEVWHWYATAQ